VWDAYAVQIDLPDSFIVAQNASNRFEASGDGIALRTTGLEDSLNREDIVEAVLDYARRSRVDVSKTLKDYKTRGFSGVSILGHHKGREVLLAGLHDAASRTNFIVEMVYFDHDQTTRASALKIMETIRPIGSFRD